MELRLQTNFRDYYDQAFDLRGQIFRRYDNEGMSRREMFSYLQGLGLKVPRNGPVRSVVAAVEDNFKDSGMEEYVLEHLIRVVVYEDEFAHAGEGKELLSGAEAMVTCPEAFCSEYIPTTPSGNGVSYRFLQVGDRRWWLRYWSEQDWRSNVGEGGVEVLAELSRGLHPKIRLPMFAVDLLRVSRHEMVAVDFNTAPGLKPLQELLRPTEVVELLKSALTAI